ncbi:MAG: glycoside hydrolase family 16 protein [Bacteroidetes bacterium]|nr:glycoside hydrolase family 16 protein [Bacteroidota bacterium]
MKFIHIISILVVLCSCNQTPEVIFEDHFDGASLNEKYWNYELGDGCPNLCGWGNNERQLYTQENLKLQDGKMIITAQLKDSTYTSSRITTKNKVEFQYGTIEVRAKLPRGHGLWPAIWMLGNDIDTNPWPGCGEIDIMEYVGRDAGVIFNSLHTPDSHGETINSKSTQLPNIEDDFHVYTATWTKDYIKFYIDGKESYFFSPKEKNTRIWPYDKPFYVLINMAIGGNFGGPEVDDSIFPKEFIIDYIKVSKL